MTHISIAVAALVLTAAGTDFRRRRVPNWLTLGGALVGFLPHTGTGGRAGLGPAAEGMLVGVGVHSVLCCYMPLRW
jgi:Flp pilus assembly protein protease CpaA